MSIKKWGLTLAILFAAALIVAGCGEEATPKTDATEKSEPAKKAEDAPAKKAEETPAKKSEHEASGTEHPKKTDGADTKKTDHPKKADHPEHPK